MFSKFIYEQFFSNFILLLFIIPIIGILLILITRNVEKIKQIGLYTMIINMFLCFYLLIMFIPENPDFQFLASLEFFTPILFGIDGISITFLVLTGVLMPICLLISDNKILVQQKLFIICYLIMLLLLNIVFTVLDILVFYISFESIIIPMFLVIGI